jgi:TolB-like protein
MSADRRYGRLRSAGAALVVALLATLAGCAASGRSRAPAPVTAGLRQRVALIPVENLTGKVDAGDVFTRVLFTELARNPTCQVVESGVVDAAMESLRVRATGSLASWQTAALGKALNAPYLMVGSALESDVVRTPDGDVPSVGLALKLIEVASGRVVWADLRVRTGDDREKAFGWGRELSRERLLAIMASDILSGFQVPTAPDTLLHPAAIEERK